MRIDIIKLLGCIFTVSLLVSCTKEVDVDVPYNGSRLVIEASIDWEQGTDGSYQWIRLTETTPFFADQTYAPISGATVIVVNDNTQAQFTFEDQGNGNYSTETFVPVVNDMYTLTVQYDGQTYTAQETMIPLETSISRVEQSTEDGVSSDDTEVTMYFDDPLGGPNYYVAQFFPSHKSLPTIWSFDDRFSDGNQSIFFYEDEDFETGDSVYLSLLGVSERYYEYMALIVTQSSQSFSGPFQTTPVQVKGNCVNANNANEEVLGYFRLSQVDREIHVIQ